MGTLSQGFYLSLAGRNLSGGLWGGVRQNIQQFFRCALSGLWSPLIGQNQGRRSSATVAGPATFLGLELKYN